MKMKTEQLKEVLDILHLYTVFSPYKKIARDMGIIFDKVNFSEEITKLFSDKDAKKEKIKETIIFLFKDQISEEIFQFLLDITDKKLLWTLTDETGKEFYEIFLKQLSSAEEIVFSSAIALSDNFKNTIAKRLGDDVKRYNSKRIIFEVDKSLTAGFTLLIRGDLLDYSFKNALIYYLQLYLENKVEKIYS